MKFPLRYRKLKQVFQNARAPALAELNGEYVVDMLSILPSLKRCAHRKVFYSAGDRVLGHNIVLHKKWGYFYVEKDVYEEAGTRESLIINYKRGENTVVVRPIRDYIRSIERNETFIGRFHYLLFGRPFFIGYFYLKRVE